MFIGIDTGGTFTDAVLYDPDRVQPDSGDSGIVAAAKAPTRTNLTLGIDEAVTAVLVGVEPTAIEMVALSTTLATNALVEGVGSRAALVFIGFDPADREHPDLRHGLGSSPVIAVAGGHESLGAERAPLDLDGLMNQATALADSVDAFAVTARFGVRNPDHELAAAQALATLGKPVACGHQLTAKLNGPRRALTCLLNARLIGLIGELCVATEKILYRQSIEAPLLMVRGDGSLVSVDVVRDRPIETVLSGPAASLIGAAHLLGSDRVLVSDIGGTTTDIGLITDGHPHVTETGAVVGGHRTMVEAVEMYTHGLGGDSEVAFDTTVEPAALVLGPRRLVPLSMAAAEAGDDERQSIRNHLDNATWPFRTTDVRLIRATGRMTEPPGVRARDVFSRIAAHWRPYDDIVRTGLEANTLASLVSHGLAEVAGFTPTDAAVVLGLHTDGDRAVAERAAEIMAAVGDLRGEPIRSDGSALARWTVDSVIRRSAEVVLAAALARDGVDPAEARGPLVGRSLDPATGSDLVASSIGLAVPLVGLGASAATYYPQVGRLLGIDAVVPRHAEVANALGAAVGQVRVARQATISQPSKGRFRIHLPGLDDRADLQPAIDDTVAALEHQVRREATEAGAESVSLHRTVDTKQVDIDGRSFFIESVITIIGVGPPRLRSSS